MSNYTKDELNEASKQAWAKLSKNCSVQRKPKFRVIHTHLGCAVWDEIRKMRKKLENNFLLIDCRDNDLRCFHPRAVQIYEQSGNRSNEYFLQTEKFTTKLAKILLKKACQNRYNVVIITHKNPKATLKILKNYKTKLKIIIEKNISTSINQFYSSWDYYLGEFLKRQRADFIPIFLDSFTLCSHIKKNRKKLKNYGRI